MELFVHSGLQRFKHRFGQHFFIGEYLMELYLQFGWGMMDHCRSLISEWGGGTAILSPRDLSDAQLVKLSKELKERNGYVLLDPQFYLPYEEHVRLQQHDYWPKNYSSGGFWSGSAGSELTTLLNKLNDLNKRLGASRFVLPGLYASEVNDDWLARQSAIIDEANRLGLRPDSLIATIALSGDATKSDQQVQDILEAANNWEAEHLYLVCEHPNTDYLVADPNWLANVLDLIAGLRLSGRSVILGYCNHQMLIAASAGANAIASGTWMNVRSFPPSKFSARYEEEIRQRTTWFYCPQALSEYKIGFLDIAKKQGVLDEMRPPSKYGSTYSDGLFATPQPSAFPFSEQTSFRHYLHCLRAQVQEARKNDFDETVRLHEEQLDQAEILLNNLHNVGVRGQQRDFKDAIDVNRAALGVLGTGYGPRLRREWANL